MSSRADHTSTRDPSANPIEGVMIWIAMAGACMTVFGFALGTPKSGLSVSAGALLGLGNLWALTGIVRALLGPSTATQNGSQNESVYESGAALAAEEIAPPATADADDDRPRKRYSFAWAAFAVLKMTVLFGGVYILLDRGWVSGIALAIGYGSLPIGMFGSALWSSLKMAVRAR